MELRVDPLRGHVSLVSEARKKRPKVFRRQGCPFCRGSEHQTPPGKALLPGGRRIVERGDERASGWLARIFPNKYPALVPNPSSTPRPPAKPAEGLHLVAVETWRHVADPHMIPLGEYREALSFILDECRAAMRSYGYLVLFKNRGRLVGASIEHCHMQIVAMKEPPPLEKTWAREAWRDRCPLCSYIAWEAEAGERVLEERDGLLLVEYWAPRQPHHMLIAPLRHEEYPSQRSIEPLALLVREATRILVEELGVENYNFAYRFKPLGARTWHWHLEILPYTQTWGGLERNTYAYIVEA